MYAFKFSFIVSVLLLKYYSVYFYIYLQLLVSIIS